MTARAHVGVALALLGLTACSAPDADPADLSGGPSAPTSGSPSASVGTEPGGLPTEGLPTQARAELRRAGDADPGVVAAWKAYQEARSESLRAHEPTPELQSVAALAVVDDVAARGPSDAASGLTVGLRPLGRLESEAIDGTTARLSTCLWGPSVGFFVEANGSPAEGAQQQWVEHTTEMEREDGRWTVTEDEATGQTCPGGAP